MEKFKQKHIKVEEQEKPEENVSKEEEPEVGPRSKISLLDQHSELKKKAAGYICTLNKLHIRGRDTTQKVGGGAQPSALPVSLPMHVHVQGYITLLHLYFVFILLSFFLLAHKVSELDKQKQEEQKILHNIQETRGKSSFYLLL